MDLERNLARVHKSRRLPICAEPSSPPRWSPRRAGSSGMSSTEVQYIRALNGKLIPRESRDPTASASAWAVKWKLPSEGSRIPLVWVVLLGVPLCAVILWEKLCLVVFVFFNCGSQGRFEQLLEPTAR